MVEGRLGSRVSWAHVSAAVDRPNRAVRWQGGDRPSGLLEDLHSGGQ